MFTDTHKMVKPDDEIWFILTASEDMPVLRGTIEAVHDDCLSVDNEYLGETTVDPDMVFTTREAAEAALAAMA